MPDDIVVAGMRVAVAPTDTFADPVLVDDGSVTSPCP